MKTTYNNDIKAEFAKYQSKATVNKMTISLTVSIIIFSYFVYSDLVIRGNIQAFYTRVLPITLGISLLVFHLFSKGRYFFAKAKTYNLFLASCIVMMFGKCLVHMHDDTLASVVAGTIMIFFAVSLDIKANTISTTIMYFVPTVLFIAILIIFFKISKNQHFALINIYPVVILGFITNRVQYRLRFNAFKSNYLLKEEKQKTEELYQETLSMNEDLYQKNEAITAQKDKIEKQHNAIISSINYAKRIQKAMLPVNEIFRDNFQDYFIIYQPRDVVSGDFYWAEKIHDKLIYAVADCTGHGVPGAMVSMLGISLLNKITTQDMTLTTAEILERLRKETKKSFKQTNYGKNATKDGMDIALCIVDTNTKELQYSGAYNSLYIHRKNELIKLKANKQPIGMHPKEEDFINHEIQLEKNDILYSFSDGFVDQFNPKGEKYKINRFKTLLTEIAENNLQEQKQIIEREFYDWKSDKSQIDDVVIVGIKI